MGVYGLTVKHGSGLQGRDATVFGFKRRLLSRYVWGCPYPCTSYTFGRLEDLPARWQSVLVTMRVGDVKRVWVSRRLRPPEVYDITLVTAHRVDGEGQLIHEPGTGDASGPDRQEH